MSGFTTYTDNKLLGLLVGDVAFTIPGTLYFGLSTTTPTAAGGNITEPSGNGYARVAVTNSSTNFTAASNGQVQNATAVSFPQATGAWGSGPITYWFASDASTAGNVLFFGALNTAQTITNGDTLTFPANDLTFSLT